MTSHFEFETIPWAGELMSHEGEFGAGQAEWESEYSRRGRPPATQPRQPARPARSKRPASAQPRWAARRRIRTGFPIIPWSGWTSNDAPPDEPPVDAQEPIDAQEPNDAIEPTDSGELFEFETPLKTPLPNRQGALRVAKPPGGRSSPGGYLGRIISDARPAPGTAACGFDTTKHAFRFKNSFDFPPVLINALKRLPFITTLGSRRMGLCGGMSFLAADHCTFGMQVPTITTAPKPNDRLYWQIAARQMDSMNITDPRDPAFGDQIRTFLLWMSLPDSAIVGVPGTKTLTTVEVLKAKSLLRQGKFAVLGLVLKSMYSDGPAALFANHQILAYGFSEPSPTVTVFNIYDPNYQYDPQRADHANLVIKTTRIDSETTSEAFTTSRTRLYPIRGFFVQPYTPKKP
jgi:hypothetical protein